uniref:Uncharacterized protein n=1 Tax=Aegilops tauschii subsp. strangulata TaxID=200361 RepID=A0A453MVY7_AEGTS
EDTSALHPNGTITSCIAGERSALLAFRAGLSDPGNILSSWKGDDCCRWKGVYCSNRTGHVVKLDLGGPDHYGGCDEGRQMLAGNISSSLLGLQHLRYLDLHCNGFDKIQIPEFIGSLHQLRYLDLSSLLFIGKIPPQLGNLSNLQYLNLDNSYICPFCTYSKDITWLSRLTSLEQLDMTYVNLSTIVHWVPVVNMLPTLKVLRLPFCELGSSPDSLLLSNLTSLETLDLSENNFHKSSRPNWFWDVSSLKHLNISANDFYGLFPDEIGNMTSIVELGLSNNNFVGMIPSSMKNLCNLELLGFPFNNINGSIQELFNRLPSCSQNKLQWLDASNCSLTGSLPTTPVDSIINLSHLQLRNNRLGGHVPVWLGELTNLAMLDLSSNNLDGVMHEGHFSRLEKLYTLDLSDNSIAITVSPTWVPPFSLREIYLRSCQLGPKFPVWLRWQKQVRALDISNTTKCPQLIFLDLGLNQFSGALPAWIGEKLLSLSFLRLRSNMFYGHIPVKLTKLVNLQYLDLAYNNISGSIPRSIGNCTGMRQARGNSDNLRYALNTFFQLGENKLVDYTENLTVLMKGQERLYTGEIIYMVNLDLSCNSLTGEIPEEISTLIELKNLNLSWNSFNGKIPENVGALMQVESLDLSHNDLSGEIPSSLSALTSLSRLNLSYNNLKGKIPAGNQLQTLEDPTSIYIGNPGLCGPPLSQNCSSKPEQIPGEYHGVAIDDVVSFFLALGSGFVMGLWVVFCTFLFKRRWRAAWYSLCDSLYDWVYVQVAVTWTSLRGKNNG